MIWLKLQSYMLIHLLHLTIHTFHHFRLHILEVFQPQIPNVQIEIDDLNGSDFQRNHILRSTRSNINLQIIIYLWPLLMSITQYQFNNLLENLLRLEFQINSNNFLIPLDPLLKPCTIIQPQLHP